MRHRAIGPAIVKDMISYIDDRKGPRWNALSLLAEAFLLWVAPQLDALSFDAIGEVYRWTHLFFKEDLALPAVQAVLKRIRVLYPHIKAIEWRDWANAAIPGAGNR